MSATEFLCRIVGVKPQNFSRVENILLEAELFSILCAKVEMYFKDIQKEYTRLIKLDAQMENTMKEDDLVRTMITDIISTGEYTLDGIACYVQMPEEVINEVVVGRNITPSALLLRKVMELHRSVRRELYQAILKKFTSEYLTTQINI